MNNWNVMSANGWQVDNGKKNSGLGCLFYWPRKTKNKIIIEKEISLSSGVPY